MVETPLRSTVVCTINTRKSLSRGPGGPGKLMPTAHTNIGSCVMAGSSVVQSRTHAGASCTHIAMQPSTDVAWTCIYIYIYIGIRERMCMCPRNRTYTSDIHRSLRPCTGRRTGNPYRTWPSIRSLGSPGAPRRNLNWTGLSIDVEKSSDRFPFRA